MGAGRSDRIADPFAFVGAEIIHHDNVAVLECRKQELRHIGQERSGVDRSVEQAGSRDLVMTQRCEKGLCFPVSVRNVVFQPDAARAPS